MGSWVAGVNVVCVLSATKQARKIVEGIEEECENARIARGVDNLRSEI